MEAELSLDLLLQDFTLKTHTFPHVQVTENVSHDIEIIFNRMNLK